MLSGDKGKDGGEEQSEFYFWGKLSPEDKAKEKKENTPKSFVIHTKDRLKPKKEGRGERIRINLRKIHHLKG